MIHVEDFDAAEMMGFGNFGSLNPQTHYHEITEDLNRIPTELERDTEDGDFKKRKMELNRSGVGGRWKIIYLFFFSDKNSTSAAEAKSENSSAPPHLPPSPHPLFIESSSMKK